MLLVEPKLLQTRKSEARICLVSSRLYFWTVGAAQPRATCENPAIVWVLRELIKSCKSLRRCHRDGELANRCEGLVFSFFFHSQRFSFAANQCVPFQEKATHTPARALRARASSLYCSGSNEDALKFFLVYTVLILLQGLHTSLLVYCRNGQKKKREEARQIGASLLCFRNSVGFLGGMLHRFFLAHSSQRESSHRDNYHAPQCR